MKNANSFLYFALLLSVQSQCSKEEIVIREYPRLGATIVKSINAGGVVVEADLLTMGNSSIMDHGFIWSDNKNLLIENSEILSFGPNASEGRFGGIINRAMRATTRYYIRPFVKTEKIIVYGQERSFISLGSGSPSIETVTPDLVGWGDTVLVTGKNFSSTQNNTVKVANQKAALLSATPNELKVVIPDNITVLHPELSIEVVGNIGSSMSVITMKPHLIEYFTPTSGTLNDTVIVYGKFPYAEPELFLGDKKAKVLQFSKNRISFSVPQQVPKGENVLTIKNGEIKSTALEKFIRTAPEILAIKPEQLGYYDTLEIIGKNFGSALGSNAVTIGGYLGKVIDIKKDTLKVIMPWGSYDQEHPMIEVVYNEQKATSINEVAIKGPAIASLTPDVVYPGESVSMKGENLGLVYNYGSSLTVDNIPVEVLTSAVSEVRFKLPYLIENYEPKVSITSAGNSAESIGEFKSPWRKIGSFPIGNGIRKAASFVIGSNAYVMTGIDGTSTLNKKVSRFSQIKLQWETLADFPGAARYDAFGIEFQGKGYLIGGRGKNRPLADFWIYDEQQNTWTEMGVTPFHAVGGAVINNELYVISSQRYFMDNNGNITAFSTQSGVWKYNATSNGWEELNLTGYSSDPSKTFYFETNNSFYVGVITGFSDYNLYKFDPVNHSWLLLGATPFPAGAAPVGFSMNGNGYLLDGKGFYKYFPDSNSWVQLSPSLEHIWSGGYLTVFRIGNNVYTGLGDYNWTYYLFSFWEQYEDVFFEFTALE